MKSVILSVQPQWCELIASGKKTIDVRKSAPKEVPFKVYIYQTKKRITIKTFKEDCSNGIIHNAKLLKAHGKVIGSFICDRIDEIYPDLEYYSDGYDIDDDSLAETCLTREQLREYGKGVTLYGWHISALKIYDKPKELSDFSKYEYKYLGGCCVNNNCKNYVYNGYYQPPECKIDGCFFKRPPQS